MRSVYSNNHFAILNALGGFPGLSRFGASNIKAVGNCLQFNINASATKNKICRIDIRAFLVMGSETDPIYLYDIYFYIGKGATFAHYCHHDLVSEQKLVSIIEGLF